jgi:hypothetical protein
VVVSSPVAPVDPVKRNVQAIPGVSGKYCAMPVGLRVHPAAAIAVHAIPANTPIANLLFMLCPPGPHKF